MEELDIKGKVGKVIAGESVKVLPEGQEFTLASGAKSRVYCDLKKSVMLGSLVADLSYLLVQEAAEKFGHVDAFAGVALGGCHLASVAARHAEVHTVYVRKEAKGHGTKSLVEAPTMDKENVRVVLLEDVTTTAGSATRALAALQEEGYDVVGVLTVVDRRADPQAEIRVSSGASSMSQAVPIYCLYRLQDLLPEGNRDLI